MGGFGILANFSKLVMTSVLTLQCGRMQQLILFGLYSIFIVFIVKSAVARSSRGAATRFWWNLAQAEGVKKGSLTVSLTLWVRFICRCILTCVKIKILTVHWYNSLPQPVHPWTMWVLCWWDDVMELKRRTEGRQKAKWCLRQSRLYVFGWRVFPQSKLMAFRLIE